MSGSSVIVTFKKGTPKETIDAAAAQVEANGGTIGHRYESSILGFSATLPDSLIDTIQANDAVDGIEADGEVSALAKSKLGL